MLIIIRGLPGSGKSTYAKTHYPNALHLENDMFHYHNGKYEFDIKRQKEAVYWCASTCRNSLAQGMDVVVSNTFTRKQFVDSYVEFAKMKGIDFKVIRLETQYGNIHEVPQDVFDSMQKGFEDYEGEEIVK